MYGTTRSAVALALSAVLGVLSLTGRLPKPFSLPSVAIPNAFLPTGFAPSIERLQKYLQIRTDHPHPDYYAAASFLNETISHLLPSADVRSVEFVPGKPIIIATLVGRDPNLPSVLLNSHTDVVPAEAEKWQWDPFGARIAFVDYQWRIYARGTQDMKSIGLQYLEALAVLVNGGWEPRRTVHVSFVPDEEIGGTDGFAELVGGNGGRLWRELNVGADLDEGLPNPGPGFNVYYGERQTWWLIVEAEGAPAHGALSPENTAAQKIHRVLDRALQFRESERQKMFDTSRGNRPKDIGDIVGVNVVFMDSGTRSSESMSGFIMNMVPSRARLGLDVRVPPQIPPEDMDAEIESWLSCGNETSRERCEGLSYHFQHKVLVKDMTERSHPFSNAFMDGLLESRTNRSIPFAFPATFHAATDARFARAVGVPSIGFSPIENTPDRLHKHDEFISVDGYLTGIKTYESIIRKLADAWPESGNSLSTLVQRDMNLEDLTTPPRKVDVISDNTEL